MRKLLNVFNKLGDALLMPINTSAVIILGLYTVVWGLWVASPFWSVFSRSKLFEDLSKLPEWLVGGAAILVGLSTVYGAIVRRPPYVYWGAGAAGMFWLVISLFYFTGDWQSTGGITSMAFAVYGGFVYCNIKINSKPHK